MIAVLPWCLIFVGKNFFLVEIVYAPALQAGDKSSIKG